MGTVIIILLGIGLVWGFISGWVEGGSEAGSNKPASGNNATDSVEKYVALVALWEMLRSKEDDE